MSNEKHRQFYSAHISNATIQQQWVLATAIFIFLYAPFLLDYGWGYWEINNIDLPSFYSASVQVFTHGESPYDRDKLQAVFGAGGYVHPYLYPPPSLLFFSPLSALDYDLARKSVLILNHLLILAIVFSVSFLLLRHQVDSRPMNFALTSVLTILSYPTIATLNHGQVNILLLALLLAFWIILKSGRPVAAALFLALSVLLKTYPLIIVLLLTLTPYRRIAWYTIVWLVLLTSLSFLIIPKQIWVEWGTLVLPSGGYGIPPMDLGSPAAIWNQSLNGFFARAFTDNPWSKPYFVDVDLSKRLTYLAAIVFSAVTALAVWLGSKNGADTLDKTIAASPPTIYLIAPLSWEHHLIYLLPSILLLLTARTKLPLFWALVFYSLCVLSAVVIAMDGTLQLKLIAVLVLWGAWVFTVITSRVKLSTH